MADYQINYETGDLIYAGGDLAVRSDILNEIYLSLKIRLGSWYGNPARGSQLYTLKKMIVGGPDDTATRAKEMCQNALQWIVDAGRATSIDVETSVDPERVLSRLNIQITAYQNGQPLVYEFFKEVR